LQQGVIKAIKENNPALQIIILAFQYPYLKKEYNWFGNTVISFNGRNKGGFAKLLLRQKIYSTLTELNNNNTICGLLSFWCGECALTGKRFADKNGLQHCCWILGQDARENNKYPKHLKLKAGELIALSDFIQQEFNKNHGVMPQHIIPAGIDPNQFDTTISKKDIDIVAAGSLIPLKQYDVLVNCIAAIQKIIPNIKAVLIGDGPEKNKLQQLITANGLQNNITLAGELPHHEVLQCMQRAKIFLHPSSYEGFGVVCAEALYAGCHVISFCQSMLQTIEQWHIVTTEEEMTKKTIQILQDEQTSYSSITFFTVKEIAKKIMQLYE
jgi:glycosyltransferase involved in cell wall biosynthesis